MNKNPTDGLLGGLIARELSTPPNSPLSPEALAAKIKRAKQDREDFNLFIQRSIRREKAECEKASREAGVSAFIQHIAPGLESALGHIIKETSVNDTTQKAYQADFKRLARTLDCIHPELDLKQLPIAPEIVSFALMAEIYSGTSPAVIARLVTATGHVHEMFGFASPTKSPLVKSAIRFAENYEKNRVTGNEIHNESQLETVQATVN